MPRIFLLAQEKGRIELPKDFEIVYVISGDDSTVMSLGKFLSPEGSSGMFFDSDIFISVLPQHSSPLELRIDQFLIPRQNLCIVVQNIDELNQLFSSKEEMDLARSDDYDFFSGEKIDSDSKLVRENILKRMNELKELTHVFIDAGFLDDGEDVPDHLPRKIHDWMVTFEDPLQKLFVKHTLPETSAPIEDGGDMTVEDEFLVNPSFRKGITVYWMKVVANFMVNNDIVTIEEISSIGNWEDPEVWNELKENKL